MPEQAQLTALLDLVKRIAGLTPPERLLEAIADAAARLFGFEAGGLRLLEGDELVVAGQWGDEAVLRTRIKVGESLSGRVAGSDEILVAHDVQADSRLDPMHRDAARRFGHQTYVGVPLRIGSRVTGVLALRSRERREPTPADLAVVQAFADHAAIALENARLYEATAAQASEVQVLRRIGLDLARSPELPPVLQSIVDAARRHTGSDAAFGALVDPATLEVETIASTGARSTAFSRYRLAPGHGIGGWFLVHKRPFRTDDYLGDPRFSHAYDDAARTEGIVANLGVPILHQDLVIGLLWVLNRTRRPFSDRDEAFLLGLADHAAVAIVNARVHAERQNALDELRASQDRLVQAERLRALGEMASGVAHDFNNLLAVILGRAQLLKLRTEDAKLRQGLSVIESAALDAAQRVRRIQEFTRTRQARPYGPVDLAQVIREAVELTRGRWTDEAQVRGVSYRLHTDLGEAPPVPGEAADLREVFTSLLLNAFDAMPQGGAVSLSLRTVGDSVVARVQDSGPGIPRDLQPRIFEPFFTTKGPRRHGLGLSVTYGIIQRHRGTIEVESGDAQGTIFTVTLPVAGPGAAPPAAAPAGGAARPARVFVVEDEASVREVLVDLLRSAGHQPVAAADGTTGLAMLDPVAPPDVALIDFGLPGMSGLEVAARLRAAHPAIPLVLVTGWADRLDPETVERSGVSRVIAKPFEADEILQVVREATRRSAPN